MKKTLIFGTLVVLCCVLWSLPGRAQIGDLRLESRVDRVESQIGRLQSQLTQLSSRVSGGTQASSQPLDVDPAYPNDPSPVEQFDNLATLAIELKLQVRELEARVAELEEQSGELP